ncbi:Transcription elongation factor SPT4 [Aphelenchoides fujianensis]|nr:Transcription elongation factor SPT4 [Aphelenchoides fujianensis]KAI6239301.1 Transcription elongation factor SPT4 [Aphelenchoides fujianensis]
MTTDLHIPRDLRGLRACLVCSAIKSADMFEAQGCDNCDHLLEMKNDPEKVDQCTSANFDGFIAVTEPDDSWVCRWQGIKARVPGLYAISVSGSLQRDVIAELRARGYKYRPEMRDKSQAQ